MNNSMLRYIEDKVLYKSKNIMQKKIGCMDLSEIDICDMTLQIGGHYPCMDITG